MEKLVEDDAALAESDEDLGRIFGQTFVGKPAQDCRESRLVVMPQFTV